MKRHILSAIILAVAATALTGCNNGESEYGSPTKSEVTSSVFVTTSPHAPLSTEDITDVPEVKTKAETREEIVADMIIAFCNKDEETFNAFCRDSIYSSDMIYYNDVYTDFCSVLQDEDIDYKKWGFEPSNFEAYFFTNEVFECVYVVYPPIAEKFALQIVFRDYDFSSETYSIKNVFSTGKCLKYYEFLEKSNGENVAEMSTGGTLTRLDLVSYYEGGEE